MMRRFSRRIFGGLLLSTLAVPAVQAAQRVWDVIVVGAGGAGLVEDLFQVTAVTPTPNLQPFWYTTPRLP